ncbi:hypothetical protein MTO96_010387 [Rhipicephalus appendiculatus]
MRESVAAILVECTAGGWCGHPDDAVGARRRPSRAVEREKRPQSVLTRRDLADSAAASTAALPFWPQ